MAPILVDKYGVSIYVRSREHLPPHVHAFYGDDEALINIRTGEVVEGYLSGKKLRIVQKWLDQGENRKVAEENFYELNPRLRPKEIKKLKVAKKPATKRKGKK
ncbi:hypothetical protein BH09BAC5_BH09BAC5_16190 [soil metagenome]